MSALPTQSVVGLPVSFDSYIKQGWSLVPVPPGSKGPRTQGWNKRENALKSSADLPQGWGVGLAHAYSGTCAIDIDDWVDAVPLLKESGINLETLYDAADAVIVDSGREGHGKLLYAMPFGLTMPSKKVTSPITGKVVYELRCASANGLTVHDVLPPSTHPTTLQPYRWAGKGHHSRLPILPMEILTLWETLTKRDTERNISSTELTASWDEVKKALFTISPDLSHDEWVSIGMALHYAGTHTHEEAQAFFLWDEWSAQSATKYPSQIELGHRWKSFSSDKDGGVKLGTLFHIAAQHGYKRPTPDVSSYFKDTTPIDPLKLRDTRTVLMPDPPMNLVPPILRQRAEEISKSVNCDVLIPLFAGLATVSAAVDKRTRLELMEGYEVPPFIWTMILGDASSKKSPGESPMISFLEKLQRERMPTYKKELLVWEALNAAYTSSKAAYSKAASDPNFLLTADATGKPDVTTLGPVAPEPPPKPAEPVLMVKDITSQKLARMCGERPHGLLCYLNEMKGWMERQTNINGDDRSTWTESFDGGTHSMDRVGEQSRIYIENFSVAIFGNVQPRVYHDVQKKLGTDGLLQRFIPVPVRGNPLAINEPIPDMFSNKAEWENQIRKIFNLPQKTYKLSIGAFSLYRDYQSWCESTMKNYAFLQSSPLFLETIGKLDGITGRMAILFHLLESPDENFIEADTMSRAILFIKTYVLQAYKYVHNEVIGEKTFDFWLENHIVGISGVQDFISISDIKRSARRQLENLSAMEQDDLVRYAVANLENAGWLAYAPDMGKGTRSTVYAVNPGLALSNADHRLKVIKAKQALLDDVHKTLREAGHDTPRQFTPGYDPKTMD